jgi:purine-binding chemotaxis protein CheW
MSSQSNQSALLHVLTFSLGQQKLAIPAINLREILDPMPCTRVPGAGSVVPWVLNVRGSVVPLAELRLPLGIRHPPEAQSETRRFVVLEVEVGEDLVTVAIVADIVHAVTTIPSAEIEPLPAASQFPAEFISGIWRGHAEFYLLPDLSAIFTTLAKRSKAA